MFGDSCWSQLIHFGLNHFYGETIIIISGVLCPASYWHLINYINNKLTIESLLILLSTVAIVIQETANHSSKSKFGFW